MAISSAPLLPCLTTRCRQWKEVQALRASGVYPFFPAFEGNEGPVCSYAGRNILNLGSNNYLGLTHDARVVASARRALDRYGTSSSGSRLMNGSTTLHCELERAWADFLGKQDAVVFTAGYLVNLGVVSALTGPGDRLVLAHANHNSIFCGSALSKADVVRFPHNDADQLDEVLQSASQPTLVVVEGVYSTSGEVAPLDRIAAVCQRRGATLLVDDAHGVGVSGGGKGTAHQFGVTGAVDLIMVTHSKSLASVGGAVAGDAEVIDWIRHRAAPFLFTAALPPACVAATLEALRILAAEPEHVERVLANGRKLHAGVQALGYETSPGAEGAIVALHLGDQQVALRVWKACFDRGLYLNPMIPPSVPSGRSLLRASVMATHTAFHLDTALSILADVKASLQLADRSPDRAGTSAADSPAEQPRLPV